MKDFITAGNHTAVRRDDVPLHTFDRFREIFLAEGKEKQIAAFFVLPEQTEYRLVAVLLDPQEKGFDLFSTRIGDRYLAFTPDLPAVCWFEREIWEQYGIVPEGHPRLKPLRFSDTLNGKENNRPQPGVVPYFTMQGEAVHEVAVGPVHAGVIEPGHFRFQCMGEDVFSLEIELGYQHRGIEKMLEQGPDGRSGFLVETAAGDSSAAEALCYHRALEALTGVTVPARGQALRQLALELERIANHTGDLGALAGDVAFLPTASYCGRIRGDFLNMTAALCGNRFGRNYIVTGGVRYDLSAGEASSLLKKVETGEKELFNALDLMFDEPSVLDRFENTGTVPKETALALGLTGVAARASGLARDLRFELGDLGQCADGRTGDVLGRALVRRQELESSLAIVKKLLAALPEGEFRAPSKSADLPAEMIVISAEEAWRGMLVHAVVTGENGKFQRCKIVDPSFHNWAGLEMALRDQQISDFPICNKSFNLSYCGHDL